MSGRRAFALIIVSFAFCFHAWAQTLPAPAQLQAATPSLNPSVSEPQRETMGFQLNLSMAKGVLSLEMQGSRSLPRTPDPLVYEDSEAVSGTYESGGLKQSRAVASFIFLREKRNFRLGFGLERTESGRDGQPIVKEGGTQGFFQLNSLLLETGVERKLERWGIVALSLGLAHGLDGKLESRYRGSPSPETQSLFIPISDRIKNSERLTISGGYHFYFAPACAIGLRLEVSYGILSFLDRSELSRLYSSGLGLELTLGI